MTETSKPATIAEIHARYLEIAPGARAGTPDPALSLARWLTFAVQRGFTRMLSPHLPMNHDEMLLMLARFEGLHLLAAALGEGRAEADRLAREVLDAAEDGGGIGEWLYEHGQALGIDTNEIDRLADAEAALEAAVRTEKAAPFGRETHRAYWVTLLRGQEPTDAYDDEEAEYQAAWDAAGQAAGSEATYAFAKNEILANAGPEWDKPLVPETIAVEYVRHLEGEVSRLRELLNEARIADPDERPSIADHPDDCRCTGCKDALRAAQADDDGSLEDAGTLDEDPEDDPWDASGRPATQDIL